MTSKKKRMKEIRVSKGNASILIMSECEERSQLQREKEEKIIFICTKK